jgi:uncharacterized protein DUF4177
MTKLQVSLMIVVLLCLSIWTGYAQGQRTSPARQIWEYRIVETRTVESYTSPADIQQLLNQAGAEGWELVRVGENRYYFKRAK